MWVQSVSSVHRFTTLSLRVANLLAFSFRFLMLLLMKGRHQELLEPFNRNLCSMETKPSTDNKEMSISINLFGKAISVFS